MTRDSRSEGGRRASRRTAGLGLAVLALVVIGASAVSFAGQTKGGDVGQELLGTDGWGKAGQSVRDDVYTKLRAVPGGPYSVRRGGKVELDGSRSSPKKKITSYQWTFTPRCPDDVAGDFTTLDGAKVKIVAICKTIATLTVSDGSAFASKSTTIRVGGKLPAVPFTQAPVVDAQVFPFDADSGFYAFGFNRCAIEWAGAHDANDSDHWLHRPDGDDVDTKQVHDPGGPYNKMFYVTGHHLRVTRQMIINSQLLPGGAVYELNNPEHKADMDNIIAAVLDHERIHGELVQKYLKSKKLKFLDKLAEAVDKSDEALQTRADAIIVDGETELKNASSETKVQAAMPAKWQGKSATIVRPNDSQPTHTYPSLANIGDTESDSQ